MATKSSACWEQGEWARRIGPGTRTCSGKWRSGLCLRSPPRLPICGNAFSTSPRRLPRSTIPTSWPFFRWEVAADGTELHELLPDWSKAPTGFTCERWTADGKYFAFVSGGQIWVLPRKGDLFRPKPSPILITFSPMTNAGGFAARIGQLVRQAPWRGCAGPRGPGPAVRQFSAASDRLLIINHAVPEEELVSCMAQWVPATA
jgi:hypothetical protein